jgi:hypothetical protein
MGLWRREREKHIDAGRFTCWPHTSGEKYFVKEKEGYRTKGLE